ncbi:cytochrome P450 [Obba rivulosa]|uniref:Cytochrome P450 n=1 Tax=Obba rivulosa TaxID=1052685 RepID=A0A8E2ATZ3_9APHY|nr:cytochrome P450 [Obba rivulosa]
MSLAIPLVLFFATLVIVTIWRKSDKSKASAYRELPLPPGPKPLPFIGNALDVPVTLPWRTYAQWAKRYGDIVHLRIFGQPVIILNTIGPVLDLLDKRSSNYSDRFLSEIVALSGWDWNFVMIRYGPYWRRHRRAFNQYLNQAVVGTYDPQQYQAARMMLRRFVFGANALRVAYGIEVPEKDDERIAAVERALVATNEGFTPGAFWVDMLPILKYVPSWVPGAGWKRKVDNWKIDAIATKEMPWQGLNVSWDIIYYGTSSLTFNIFAQRETSFSPIAIRLLERISHLDGEAYREEEDIIKNVVGLVYAAGAETTVSSVHSFFLAMTIYQEVQKRAQEQLMQVVGPNRLPEFSDRPRLPYIDALCKECLRWQPVVPLGVAHRSMVDDEYNGFFIPAGSAVMQNTWAILHDPEEYPEPEEFKPERFLKNGQLNPAIRDPAVAAFGAGRRSVYATPC